jgi:hypothetical protein
MDPPDSIPNSEVKRLSADDSVRLAHAKVGHRQASFLKNRFEFQYSNRFFFAFKKVLTKARKAQKNYCLKNYCLKNYQD